MALTVPMGRQRLVTISKPTTAAEPTATATATKSKPSVQVGKLMGEEDFSGGVGQDKSR